MVLVPVANKYCQAQRNADPSLDAEANAYFTSLNNLLKQHDTQLNYFWYNMTMDLSDFDPYSYPQTELMRSLMQEQQLAAEAANPSQAIQEWFQAWSTSVWSPVNAVCDLLNEQFPSQQVTSLGDQDYPMKYAYNKFYRSNVLLDCFYAWAHDTSSVHTRASLHKEAFFKLLAGLAQNELRNKLVARNPPGVGRGYKVLVASPDCEAAATWIDDA